MLEKDLVHIISVEVQLYPNQYTEAFKTNMFEEKIRIDVLNCVYRRWQTTQYLFNSENEVKAA